MTRAKNPTPAQLKRAKAVSAAGRARAYRRKHPNAAPYVPGNLVRVPRGPSGAHAEAPVPQIATGLELGAQTVHVNAAGDLLDRYDKSRLARASAEAFVSVPETWHTTKITNHTDAAGRIDGQYTTFRPDAEAREREFWAACERRAEAFAGKAGRMPRPRSAKGEAEDRLVVIPIGDPHIGMLAWAPETGENFDLKIADRELRAALLGLIADAPEAGECIIGEIGDCFHAQDNNARTPASGHPLDTDGRFPKVFDVALALFIAAIDAAQTKYRKVRFRAVRGNHDPDAAFMIAAVLRAWYRDVPDVTIENALPWYQYDVFGATLIGWHHGHGAKAEQLAGIMARDRRQDWGATTEGWWITGHIHHRTKVYIEQFGVTVETLGILPPADAWHAMKGYAAKRMIEAITLHREFGEIGRVGMPISKIRAMIAAAGATRV